MTFFYFNVSFQVTVWGDEDFYGYGKKSGGIGDSDGRARLTFNGGIGHFLPDVGKGFPHPVFPPDPQLQLQSLHDRFLPYKTQSSSKNEHY